MLFPKVDSKINFPELEKRILDFWEKKKIFKKSVEKNPLEKSFIFYEGPPTANGKPGIHHVLARAFKDIIPRYKTMQGYRVERKAGWDTHGLPVELEVEKKLGISGKPEIEKIKEDKTKSIIAFNEQCRRSVWEYKSDWENMTKRMGFWIDLEDPYITYDNNYIESVWWVLGEGWKKKLVYKGHKVVPYCPRCGTSLSSHEVALGYREIKEDSIYVAFRLKEKKNEYILAWTTTPWTLPGNVALAVGPQIDYVKIRLPDGDYLILGKERLGVLRGEYEIVEEMKGKDLEGLKYEPLFNIPETQNKNSHRIILADFVTTEDGTGVVHTAVMYGEEDYEVGIKAGLPAVHTVGEDGKFLPIVSQFAGKFVKDAEEDIKEDLRKRHLLYKTEKYTHTYPFCWRCNSPLLYYAKDSWFLAMSKLKKELLENNEKINWVPDYIKYGRFGEWLENVKDWALSRDRYWGTPIPIWECEKCDNKIFISSISELQEKALNFDKVYKKILNNNYILVRHGEAENNARGVLACLPQYDPILTQKGKKQIGELAENLAKEKIDLIFCSSYKRACETAEIIIKKLRIKEENVNYDQRLGEINVGVFNGKNEEEFDKYFDYKKENRFLKKVKGGENWVDVEKRIKDFFEKIERKFKNKNILIISHGDPLILTEKYLKKLSRDQALSLPMVKLGGMRKIQKYNIDLHKPYIDEIKIKCQCGKEMKRISQVLDCWFDSGAMPYAQFHYPYENKNKIDSGKYFPADFISEAIDQTRGWFYTLHALSTVLEKGNAFKNVICLGHVLDSKGEKMSKSKGNVIDPMEMGDKHGFDAIRWYFYTNNQPGEAKLVSEQSFQDQIRKFFLILWNIYSFFITYANLKNFTPAAAVYNLESTILFDKWLLSRKHQTIKKITDSLEKYDVFTAARTLEDFVIELSTWYVRRNKKREDKEFLQILYFTLIDTTKLLAPFAPFISEEIFKNLTKKESVHLEKWLQYNERLINKKLEEEMEKVRKIIELGHAIRKEQKIKVRQPLSELRIKNQELKKELRDIIIDELNVKNVNISNQLKQNKDWVIKKEGNIKIALNIKITPVLKEEGMMREIIRLIQDGRKQAKYAFNDKVKCYFQTSSEEVKKVIKKFNDEIRKQTVLSVLKEEESKKKDIEKQGRIDDQTMTIVLLK